MLPCVNLQVLPCERGPLRWSLLLSLLLLLSLSRCLSASRLPSNLSLCPCLSVLLLLPRALTRGLSVSLSRSRYLSASTVTTGLLTGPDAPALVNSAEAAVGTAAPLLAGRLSAGRFCEEVRRLFWRSSYLRLHFSLKSSCCPPLQPRTASPCPYLSGLLLLPRAWASTLDLPGPLSRS